MGKGNSRNQRYFNDPSLRGKGSNQDYGKKVGQAINFIPGGLQIDREKQENYDWENTPLGKLLMATLGKLYFTYFTTYGRSVRKKAKEMEKANKLEKDLKNVESEEVLEQ